jgi:DNA-binding NarL/FixJ family response regulator
MEAGGRVTPTVILASPRTSTRRRWARLLEDGARVRLAGEARTGPEALAWSSRRPRILLLDGALCAREGPALVRRFRRRSPWTRILVVTAAGLDPLDALAHGARGYLAPEDLPTFLGRAVRAIHQGEAWVPRRMVARVRDRLIRLTVPPGGRRD